MLKHIYKYIKIVGILILSCLIIPIVFIFSFTVNGIKEFYTAVKETLDVVWYDDVRLVVEEIEHVLKNIWEE